jgi:tRNA(Ile)-lysidine synthase
VTPRIAVAASGGRDSTALLHCTVRQARALGVEVVALHVQHGLVAGAQHWSAQVSAQCRRWGALFLSTTLQSQPLRGQSTEAWARRERYRALAHMARQAHCGVVLLAQHRRDQAETWLLQALRGAGEEGLAAMPAQAHRDDVTWCRPWLQQPREAIEAYVRRHRLRFVDDPSNADTRLARNRLRHDVWPALAAAFADVETTLGAAAQKAQQGAALAREVAELDLPGLTQGPGLRVAAWCGLPEARRRNALRFWLAERLDRSPPESLLRRLMDELPRARSAQWQAPGAVLGLYRGLLRTRPSVSVPATATAVAAPLPEVLDLSRPGRVALAAWQGHFVCRAVASGGVAATCLRAVTACARLGGEHFRLAQGASARSLKKQYQARAVPQWQRVGPLLVDAHGCVVFVPGLGPNADAVAPAGANQLELQWVPDEAGSR